MHRQIVLTGPARDAIRRILSRSEREFGSTARHRYAALINAALDAIATGQADLSAAKQEIGGRMVFIYPLRFSRNRVETPPGRVVAPVHSIV